jgi:hypothetical protein
MSLQVELEPDDRKFISGVRSWWEEAKRQFIWMGAAFVIGFGFGKLYTWDTTITDCKVLGTFRIANTAFVCKMLAP